MQIFSQTIIVSEQQSAIFLGSGTLPVFATPAMIALMENTAMQAMSPILKPDECSVGIEIHARHLKASAIGAKLSCAAHIIRTEGRKLSFDIQVVDELGNIIGTAEHHRLIVHVEKFMEKLVNLSNKPQ